MTTNDLTELQARIAHLHDLAAYFAPAYAQPDVAAVWSDICTLIGVEQEAVAMAAARAAQTDLFEMWGPC